MFDYHVNFNPKFYTLRARIRYEAETYARRDEGKKTQQNKDQRTISEDMDFNNNGPATTQRLLMTNELTDKTQKDDKKDDKKEQTTPQPTESTEIHKETKPAEKTMPQPKEAVKRKVTVTSSHEKTTPQPKEAAKRKITVTSSPPQPKKTRDIPKKKDPNVTTIVINGKACTQRSLDFSEDKPKSKIPTSKVRLGQSPGNPGHEQKLGPRQRSRTRHRDSGSGEGREVDPTGAKF